MRRYFNQSSDAFVTPRPAECIEKKFRRSISPGSINCFKNGGSFRVYRSPEVWPLTLRNFCRSHCRSRRDTSEKKVAAAWDNFGPGHIEVE